MSAQRKKALMAASVASMIRQFNMPNIRLLYELGYEVHVACNFKKGNTCDEAGIRKLQTDLGKMGVVWHQWDCPRSLHAAHMCMIAYLQLYELIKNNSFDLVHCHSPIGGALARMAAHKAGVPVIYTAHGFHFYRGAPFKNWLLYYPAEKLLAYWTDVLITVNKEDYAFAKRNLKAAMIYRIPGVGVDPARFLGRDTREAFRERWRIPRDAVLLLSVGELNERKNHRIVMQALAKLHRSDVYYLICGQGRLQKYLLQYARQLGIERQVRLSGYLEQIAPAYQAADIFVFPSRQEGMPVALMEAMTFGLACAASDIRGNRELIRHRNPGQGETGILDAPGALAKAGGVLFSPDHAAELACVLRRLIEDPKLRRMCGAYARLRSAHYGIAVVDERMRMIYQRLDVTIHGSGMRINCAFRENMIQE